MSQRIKFEVWQINRGIEMRHFLILAGLLTYFESFYVSSSITAHANIFKHGHAHRRVENIKRIFLKAKN